MGHGSYTSADWTRLKTSKKISKKSDENNIFEKSSMDPKFDPKFIAMRESRDSEDHPDSTPIILGLDVTGSMGYLASQIAKEGLHETMMKLFSTKPVNDPQIMFSAIGDVVDDAPLQVTQFESDIRIAKQLMELWLEGRGGDGPEDYPLLWYFAAKHTSTDRYEKRGKKGYIFTIGDADAHKSIDGADIKSIFGDAPVDISIVEAAKLASEKYELFHINIIGVSKWIPPVLGEAIPGRIMCIPKNSIDALPELIVSTLMLFGGKSMDEVIGCWSEQTGNIVRDCLETLVVSTNKGVEF